MKLIPNTQGLTRAVIMVGCILTGAVCFIVGIREPPHIAVQYIALGWLDFAAAILVAQLLKRPE